MNARNMLQVFVHFAGQRQADGSRRVRVRVVSDVAATGVPVQHRGRRSGLAVRSHGL